ncbi:MAG TPA: alkene reductase [Usitatibacter sp.]|jgi:N-ethylmaleimide reductase|nr:alkene reductase [Usitatibacter sp.]
MSAVAAPRPATDGETSGEKLFEPVQVGRYTLGNRIVMAPLTRSRARQPGNVPTALNACYYAQRASAGLIITEATQVSMQGQGYAWTPGIHSREQVEAWRLVTHAVHDAGGLIFMQLWHVGRISHPALQPDNMLPVAPSAIRPAGQAFIEDEQGQGVLVPFETPRALQLEEMPYLVRQYERGARNALAAAMDGVEVHGANGYLIDQFLCTKSNRRVDEYGGSVQNRSRLLFEAIEAAAGVWGADRVGVRLSPLGTFNDVGDDDPQALYGYVAERLNDYALAYVHVINPASAPEADPRAMPIMDMIRAAYRGNLIVAGGFDHATAESWLEGGKADLVAFGRKFIANPDLPERFRRNLPLNADDPATYYGGGAHGYTDYPSIAQQEGRQPQVCVDSSWR